MTRFTARDPLPQEYAAIARLWHDSWHAAHDTYVPHSLIELRDISSMEKRLADMQKRLRVAGPPNAPLGLCAIKTDEIDQLFVAAVARGTGLAAVLLADGEARIAAQGFTIGHLNCVIQNDRAKAFYKKCGWIYTGDRVCDLETPAGPFPLQVSTFTKSL